MQSTKAHYDLIVLGGGPGGTPVAIEYAKLNQEKKILLIDSLGKLGGECLFQGCIPSKIMEASARYTEMLGEMEAFGIVPETQNYTLVWDTIKKRKEEILDKRTAAAAVLVSTIENIDMVKGDGIFESPNSIKLTAGDDEKTITFAKAVIATGSRSFIPHYDGNGADKIWTNSDFFAKMELPESIGIIGSGAIAVELAMILSRLGVEVSLFVRSNKILKHIDVEASEVLLEKLQNMAHVNLLLNSTVEDVTYENDSFSVGYTQGETKKQLTVQRLLSAAGRVPNLESLQLEKAGVEYDKKGIIVNKHLKTSNAQIFANGDVAKGYPQFAHTAQYGAHTIAQNLFLEHDLFSVNYDINSWVLFTEPNYAEAGISEAEAHKRGLDVIVDKFDFATEAKSQIENEDAGYLKFVVKKKSKKIIGISILHPQAQAIGGEAALIVGRGLKLKDIINTIHPHPTISEAFIMLAKKMMGEIMLKKLEKPIVKQLLKIERWL